MSLKKIKMVVMFFLQSLLFHHVSLEFILFHIFSSFLWFIFIGPPINNFRSTKTSDSNGMGEDKNLNGNIKFSYVLKILTIQI